MNDSNKKLSGYEVGATILGAIALLVFLRDMPRRQDLVAAPPPQPSKPIWDFLRHPIVVSFIGIVIGGFGLSCAQNRVQEKSALLAKRMQVAEEISDYRQVTDSFLRNASTFFCQMRRGKLSPDAFARREVELQQDLNAAYGFEAKVRAKLHLYFPLLPAHNDQQRTPLVQFQKASKLFHDEVNLVYGQKVRCEAGGMDSYFLAAFQAEAEVLNTFEQYIPVPRIKIVKTEQLNAL